MTDQILENAQALWAPAQNLQIITFPVHDEAHEDPALHTQREGKLEDLTQHEEPEDKREIHACVRVSRIIVAKEKVDDVFLAVCNLHWLLQDMVGKQAIHEGKLVDIFSDY